MLTLKELEPLIKSYSIEHPGISAQQVLEEYLATYNTDSPRFPDLIARMEKRKMLKEGFLDEVKAIEAKRAESKASKKLDKNVIRHYTSNEVVVDTLYAFVEQGFTEESPLFQTAVNELVEKKLVKAGLLSWREREHRPLAEGEAPPKRRGRPPGSKNKPKV